MYTAVAIILTIFVRLCWGLNYTDLVALKNCEPWDSCKHDSQTLPVWQLRHCYCDELCDKYADCCLDSKHYNAQNQTDNLAQHACVSVWEDEAVYMKGSCMDGWEDGEVSELCASGFVSLESNGGRPDPLSSLPSTSFHTGHTYTNYYCAICNNDSLALRMWKMSYSCDSVIDLTTKGNQDNLVYQNNTWGLFLQDNGTTDFHECSIHAVKPDNVTSLTRQCTQAVSNCSEDWNDDVVATQCQSYTSVVYNLHQPYRNPHCALCNDVLNLTSCNFIHFGRGGAEPVSFAVILDFNDFNGGNLVGLSSTCKATEIWDPFFKKCRNIVCARPNEVFRYGRCVDEGDVNTTISSEPTSTSLTPTPAPTLTPTQSDTDNVGRTGRPIVFPQSTSLSSWPSPGTHATPTLSSTAVSANASADFLECYKVFLTEEEFETFDNGTLYVNVYGRSYDVHEYETVPGGVLVCWPDVPTEKFSPIMGWLSLVGLGLSCLCLLLHLAAFVLTPRLRNLSARNLSSLSVALLAAYISFLASVVTQPGHMACFVLAAAMYYFFLSSFAWMSAIAFDIWYTFHMTKRELRVTVGNQWHRFLGYCLYAWLLPGAALALVVLVDVLEPQWVPEDLLPRLGQSWCWFAHRKALLIFFALPMVVILLANSAFFISTAVIITETTLSFPNMAGGRHNKSQYKMYLRLAVLMGFTWISGIVAGYLQVEAAWYIFVLLNTLQGVFIFLAFTCRRKVWRAIGSICIRLGQRKVSWVAHNPPSDNHALELSQTADTLSSSRT